MKPSDYALSHEDIQLLVDMAWVAYVDGYTIDGDPKTGSDAKEAQRRYRALRGAVGFVSDWKWPETYDDDAKIIKKLY